MTYKKGINLLIAVFLITLSAPAWAQQPTKLDNIAAVVGKNRIILQSDIMSQIEQMKQQDPSIGDDYACNLLQQMVLQKMLVEQAERDSVIVTNEDVDATLDNRIRYFISLYGSQERLEEISGKTIYQLKEENREVIRETMTAERMQGEILQNVKVTPAEVQSFFQQIPADSLPFFPATVEIGQVVIDPEVSPELDSYARAKLEGIRKDIVENDKSFEVMAGFYSDDPGSRDNGGLIEGMTRDGGFVVEFSTAAFKLQDGEISPLVKTKFGYHIIQMVKRKGDRADVRHILIRPERTTGDFQKALDRLDSVRAKLITGQITFQEAVNKYSTDEMSNRTGGMVADPQTGTTALEIDKLDPTLALMVDSLKPGSFSKPMIYTNERGEKSTRIVYMKNITTPHKANLTEDYSRIQQAALQKKKSDKMQEWIDDKAPTYYIKVAPEYQQCDVIKDWVSNN